jgi:hypothetical protein
MTKTKPTKQELRRQLDEQRNAWNERYPLGSSIVIRPPNQASDPRETRTRSQAWVVGGASVMVMVEGAPGVVAIDDIESVTPARRSRVVR